ncbi:hypothetical protein U8527_06600 [Kordia algicida OT-1]|uniref:Uncharacterized protein n=1 Tax=Kordia algicida OT-1 TaxID=391587 RepID=A9E1Z8_9FLAO|nr:hypothetical protein [Kordia algicida]EDP95695.1 hypothetical protein KAOT1_22626 [Kordia algicida OT-1]
MSNISNNRLSITLTEETITEIKTKIEELSTLMPFLIGLTPSERMSLPKISRSNKLFVDDAITSMENTPEVLPSYLNPLEVKKDYVLYQQLSTLSLLVDELAEKINDTRILAGSEAYASSLMAYRMYKAATDSGIPGVETTYQRLQQRFANQGPSNTNEATDNNADNIDTTNNS